MRSRKFASRNENPLRRGGHAAIVQTSRRGAASHVPSHKQKPQGRTGGALKRSKKQLIRNGCHRPFSDAREIRATPRNSASRFRPNNQRPDLLECIAADAARRWSPPAHRRTAKPSTSATGDMPDVLPRGRRARTRSARIAPGRHSPKNTNGSLPTRPVRSAAADRLAAGCNRKSSVSRTSQRQLSRRVNPSCQTGSEAGRCNFNGDVNGKGNGAQAGSPTLPLEADL
jgi:hypothetical protein